MLVDELETSPSVPSKEANHSSLGPGSRLCKIREAKHLTLNEMAKRIRLNPERLIQIENDDYMLMGAPAFAKGYLRAYASQLGIAKKEIAAILQAFDDLGLGADIQHSKPQLIHEKIDQQHNPKMTRWVGYFIVVLLLGLLGYLWYSHFNGLDKKTTSDDKETSPLVTTTALPDSMDNSTLMKPATLETLPVQAPLSSEESKTAISDEPTPTEPSKESSASSKNREGPANSSTSKTAHSSKPQGNSTGQKSTQSSARIRNSVEE